MSLPWQAAPDGIGSWWCWYETMSSWISVLLDAYDDDFEVLCAWDRSIEGAIVRDGKIYRNEPEEGLPEIEPACWIFGNEPVDSPDDMDGVFEDRRESDPLDEIDYEILELEAL